MTTNDALTAYPTASDAGEVISSDPIARLYVHCIYYPGIYTPAPPAAHS
jgi:hypothetical protein